MDAFGIPFVGFPVEKRKRPRTGEWGHKPVWIEKDDKKARYRVRVPNVRSWAVGMSKPLRQAISTGELPEIVVNPKETPPEVYMHPVVGGKPQVVMTLDEFRHEYPVLKTTFILAKELLELTSPGSAADLGVGPTFDELLDAAREYVDTRVRAVDTSDRRDLGIYYWRQKAVNVLDTAIRNAQGDGTQAVPILGSPEYLDSELIRRFQWTGIIAKGRKCHLKKLPCHTKFEADFAAFLDRAKDVIRYFKNERFGFSVTYYENNRPRQYFPDFIVVQATEDEGDQYWVAETKGEIRANTALKRVAAEIWCRKMSGTAYGNWSYLFTQQRDFYRALEAGVRRIAELAEFVSG